MRYVSFGFLVLICCFMVVGCPTNLRPYYCRALGYGMTFENQFGRESDCSRSFMGYSFKGYGSVRNDNEFNVYVEIERTYYRNSGVVGSFAVPARTRQQLYFTGGDTFRIKKESGVPVGVVNANVLYDHDGTEKVYIGRR